MKSIIHTGVTVSNLEKPIEWYRDVLGLELASGPSEVIDDDNFSKAVGVPGAVARYCMLKVGSEYLELFEYTRPVPETETPQPMYAVGPSHVCFLVDDIEAKVAELTAKGVEFFSPVQVDEQGVDKGSKWVYFADPDGIPIELMQAAPSNV